MLYISLYCNVVYLTNSFPGADDTTLFTKFETQHKGHSHYHSPQRKLDDPVFTITHYAGEVVYHIRVSDGVIPSDYCGISPGCHSHTLYNERTDYHNTLLLITLCVNIQ